MSDVRVIVDAGFIAIEGKIQNRQDAEFVIRVLSMNKDSMFPETKLYNVILKAIPAGKNIHTIKAIRSQTGMSLKEAKDLTDRVAPFGDTAILTRVSIEKANNVMNAVFAEGCAAYVEEAR